MANYTTSVLTPTNQAQSQGTGPTAALSQDPYSVSQLKYPTSGLGTDIPSYVVFYINLPTASKYFGSGGGTPDNKSAAAQNYNTLQSQGGTYQPIAAGPSGTNQILGGAGLNELSSVVAGGDLGALGKAAVTSVPGGALVRTLDLKPKLSRIAQSIAIYMPETITTQYQHSWDSVSATDAGGNIAKFAQLGGVNGEGIKDLGGDIKTIYNNFMSGGDLKFNSAQSAEIAGSIGESAGVVGQNFTDLSLKSMGRAVNPHTEMLFRATQNREFVYDFHFVPRSAQEATVIENIITAFKTYSHPEVSTEASGRYFIPPGVFDIQFYFQTAENPKIGKISTCALQSMIVNYAGAGQWSTFSDGSPLHIFLTLNFKEVDIITRELIQKYGY